MIDPTPTPGAVPGRRSVRAWVLYDLANTIFAFGVVGVYIPAWLLSVDRPDSALAFVQIAAAVVVIFVAPWAGARTDATGIRLPTLILTTVVAVGATFFLDSGPELLTLVLLWMAVVAVNTGSVVYDALLVTVSTQENRGWISGLGVGVGYFGSFIGLGLGLLTFEALDWGYSGTFRAMALGFLIFALPAFFRIEERPRTDPERRPGLSQVAGRLIAAWRLASHHDGVVRFLVGRFFYTDAINTLLVGFLGIFVMDELGLDLAFFTALMGVAITAAVFGGLGAGRILSRVSPLRLLRFVLILWMIGIGMGVTANLTGVIALAWLIGPLGGLALGATWAADRVVMARISPPRHLGEFYGLYATVGRFATIVGPLVWALIVDALGLSRNFAMGALAGFVAIAWWILRRVDDTPRLWLPEDDLPVRGNQDGSRT